MRSIENYLEHIYKQLFHKIDKTGTRSSCLADLQITDLFGWKTFLKNGGLVDLNATGGIPRGNAGLFFHIEDLAAAHPVEGFL